MKIITHELPSGRCTSRDEYGNADIKGVDMTFMLGLPYEEMARQYDGVFEWAIEQQRKEQAMLKAIDKELIFYRSGALYLCFRDEAGRYYPISGDGMIFPELAGLIQMTYEKELEKSDA